MVTGIDLLVFRLINEHLQNGFFDFLMPFLSRLGNNGEIWIGIFLAFLILGGRRGRTVAAFGFAALLLTFFLNDGVLKELIKRPRPFDVLEGVRLLGPALRSYSFPSGHSASAFAAATVLLAKVRGKWKYLFLLLAFLIALSRIYVGVHYPSDVLAGALMGIIISVVVLRNGRTVYTFFYRSKKEPN